MILKFTIFVMSILLTKQLEHPVWLWPAVNAILVIVGSVSWPWYKSLVGDNLAADDNILKIISYKNMLGGL